MNYKFEIFPDKKGRYRFRFLSPNNKKMFQSEGYQTMQAVLKAIDTLKASVTDADVITLEQKEDE